MIVNQVFKFEPGKKTPSLTLGKAFQSATSNEDVERFCKPTDVAVASNGDFFVSDGLVTSFCYVNLNT
jgi:peptidylamidoglycolate lyase